MLNNFPVMCRDCKWAIRSEEYGKSLHCANPIVNQTNVRYLSSTDKLDETEAYKYCSNAREGIWFAKCGVKGKLFYSRYEAFGI